MSVGWPTSARLTSSSRAVAAGQRAREAVPAAGASGPLTPLLLHVFGELSGRQRVLSNAGTIALTGNPIRRSTAMAVRTVFLSKYSSVKAAAVATTRPV